MITRWILKRNRFSKQKGPKTKAKDSILKGKGRISVPDGPVEDQIQSNYEDLRKMPFSLVDEDINQINSPMQKYMSIDDEYINPNSLQMEALDDNQLADCHDDGIYQSFEFFNEEISKIDNDGIENTEIKNKQNNIADYSNLYLNLSNKISHPETVIVDSGNKLHDYKSQHILHTTGKSNHWTGDSLTYIDWFKTKTNLNKLLYQDTHEISIESFADNKSYTWNRVQGYSVFDEQSEKGSNITDFRQTLTSKNKIRNIRPGIIKGFWSSDSSSKSDSYKHEVAIDKEVDMRHQF